MRIKLVDALSELRVEVARMALEGETFAKWEMSHLAHLLTEMETEALRLEAIEVAARTKALADRAAAEMVRAEPAIDIANLEDLIRGDKVVLFPVVRRPAAERRPA